jgi:hypothetical protein
MTLTIPLQFWPDRVAASAGPFFPFLSNDARRASALGALAMAGCRISRMHGSDLLRRTRESVQRVAQRQSFIGAKLNLDVIRSSLKRELNIAAACVRLKLDRRGHTAQFDFAVVDPQRNTIGVRYFHRFWTHVAFLSRR